MNEFDYTLIISWEAKPRAERIGEMRTYDFGLKTYVFLSLVFISIMIITFFPTAQAPELEVQIGGEPAQFDQSEAVNLETFIQSQHNRAAEVVFPKSLSTVPTILKPEFVAPRPGPNASTETKVQYILDHSVNLGGKPQAGSVTYKNGEIILK